jgi:hypothetical protein
MSYQSINPAAEYEAEEQPLRENIWQSAWNNNKGACLILLAELAGASMDAMARFLQQGNTKFHPFQVRNPDYGYLRPNDDRVGYRCTHGYYLYHEQHIHVVDKSSRLSVGRSKRTRLANIACCFRLRRTVLFVL